MGEPIRIAQIVGKWVGGGVEAVIMNYYRNIDKSKIQFDFICDSDSTNIPYEEIEYLGGKVILIPPYQKVFKYHKELKRVLKEGNYKIVHSHINTLSVFSLYAAKCASIPIRISHSHSTTNKKEWKKNLIKLFLKPFNRIVATNYMACTEHAARWMFGNKNFAKGRVFLLNNAIDLDRFKYNELIRNENREKLKINNDTLVLGHVGRFVEQKNHIFLIEVFNEFHKKYSDSILILVGQGPLMGEVKTRVEELKLDTCVKFLGQIDNVNEIYNMFDVFLLPSLYEGLGMVLIEAQENGLYCVASSVVPRESKISDRIEFIDFEKGIYYWSDRIINNNKYNRKINVDDEKYNIKKNYSKLMEYYLEAIGNYEK